MALIDTSGLEPFAAILTELYKDMAQPAARNIGLALGAFTSAGLFLHLLTSWGTDKLNICLKSNLDQYAERIKDIPVEDITEVPPEIATPIIEKLSYVTNEELRNLYIELLAKASIKNENNKAHPRFVNIINSLSPDEAQLIRYLKDKKWLPFVDIVLNSVSYEQYFLEKLVCIIPDLDLVFNQNLNAYLNNLAALGLITIINSQSMGSNDEYKHYEQYLVERTPYYDSIEKNIMRRNTNDGPYEMIKGIISTTSFGQLFFDAVI